MKSQNIFLTQKIARSFAFARFEAGRRLHLISTQWGASWALQAFLTSPRKTATPPQDGVLMLADAHSVMYEGKRLRVWEWQPASLDLRDEIDGKSILLVHGWGGSAAQLTPWVGPLLKQGYRVVAYDAPAHGQSDGRLSHLLDFSASISLMNRQFGPFHGVVAHSFGGAGASLALAEGLPIRRAVLLAAPSDLNAGTRRFAQAARLPEVVRLAMVSKLERMIGRSIKSVVAAELTFPERVKALIFHDRQDREVSWENGAALAAMWPGAEFVTTQGLGHNRILKDEGVQARALEFLAAMVAEEHGETESAASVEAWSDSDSEYEFRDPQLGEISRALDVMFEQREGLLQGL